MSEKIIKMAKVLCEKFINKAETGRARSRETYAECKELLKAINETNQPLENFLEIYNKELAMCDADEIEHLVLSCQTTRMFVYEICKKCIVGQHQYAPKEKK